MAVAAAHAAPTLIATGILDQPTDFSPVTEILENGLTQNVLGGIGSGLTWAGGTTFLGIPDRGPNATPYTNGPLIDNTASFISRVEILDLKLTPAVSGGLPFTLTPSLKATTLLSSPTPLIYGSTPGLGSAIPAANQPGKYFFTGRSDNFGSGLSTNPDFARFDPEAIRVSNDGNTFFIADEYGPFVYQFDRATGQRIRAYTLPDRFAISHLYSVGAAEISGNTSGRVTNKGAEGLAITPDGSTLVLLIQSPLIQDGGDGGRANRVVTIDIASGGTHEYVYDNKIGSKAYNSSEIIALNDHQFLIDTRDGKGLGDGSVAVVKQLWGIDIAGAFDVSGVSGEAALLAKAVPKKLFLDVVSALTANGFTTAQIPAKLEGLAFGKDVVIGGVVNHTLYIANDNDFIPNVAGPNRWFVFGVTDSDLAALGYSFQPQAITERGPDLALSKSASSASVITGTDVEYTLTVSNTGLVPAANVVVQDLLPAGLSLTGCVSTGVCGSGATGPTISIASLAGPQTQSATLSAKVGCAVADGIVISNQANAAFDLVDPTPDDNVSAVSITAVNPAPAISGISVDKPELWPPNGKMIPVHVNYGVSDNCAGTVCSLDVISSEAAAKGASLFQIVDEHNVMLRADRNGNGPGRTYSIPITCKDSGGALSVSSATVLVPHNQ